MSRRLLVSYLALAIVVLALLEIPLAVSYARNERHDLSVKVERDAVALASLAEDALERDVPPRRRSTRSPAATRATLVDGWSSSTLRGERWSTRIAG